MIAAKSGRIVKVALVLIGLLSIFASRPLLAVAIPGDPYYTSSSHKNYLQPRQDYLWNSQTLERIFIDGKDHPFSEALKQQVIDRVQNSEACQLSHLRHRLYVQCYKSPAARQRNRYGKRISHHLNQLQVNGTTVANQTTDDEQPQPYPVAPEDEDYSEWLQGFTAADLQSVLNVMGSVFDGGFKHDNRQAGEQIDAMAQNLDRRINDLAQRQLDLDEILAARRPVVEAQYQEMNQRYQQNSQTLALQANYHRQLIINTRSDIHQRTGNSLPPSLSPDAIQTALQNQFNHTTPGTSVIPPADFPDNLFNPPVDLKQKQQQTFARERFKQQVDFDNSRARVKNNLATGKPDPVFDNEAELDLVESYGRYKLRLAENLSNGDDDRIAKLTPAKQQKILDGLLQDARSARYFASGLVTGVSQSVVETAQGFIALPTTISALITNADDIALALYDSAVNYQETADIIYNLMKREWANYEQADEAEKGRVIGKLLGSVVLEIAGPGMAIGSIRRIGSIGRLGKLGKTVERMKLGVAAASTRINIHRKIIEKITSRDPEMFLRATAYRTRLLTRYHSNKLDDALLIDTSKRMQKKLSLIDDSLDGLRAQNKTITQGHYDYLAAKAENLNDWEWQHGLDKVVDGDYFKRVAPSYARLEINVRLAPQKKLDATVWRAIPKKIPNGNNPIINTAADIFREHDGIYSAVQRYSFQGQHGLYTVLDDSAEAASRVIKAEYGVGSLDNHFIGQQKVSLKKVLDLTDQDTLDTLGIDNIDLLKIHGGWNRPGLSDAEKIVRRQQAYELTHQIGHTAARAGYDGILYPSAPTGAAGGTGLVILKPTP